MVAENTEVGTAVTHLLATDPDLGINGLVRYQLPEPQGEIDGTIITSAFKYEVYFRLWAYLYI